ncbi:mycofactocin biosynthesis peptidyl-dipeptidase MftE [Modestobacter lapidis]
MPLDTDAFIADSIVDRLQARRPAAAIAPLLPLGASGEHADFPGTLSIGTAATTAVVVELVRHASGHWPAVLVVNGHGGNDEALRAAARTCAYEGRRLAVVHLSLAGMDAHAGRAETSIMLHLAPERVRLDLAEPGTTAPLAELLPRLLKDGVRAVSPNGVLGDPTEPARKRATGMSTRSSRRRWPHTTPARSPPTADRRPPDLRAQHPGPPRRDGAQQDAGAVGRVLDQP